MKKTDTSNYSISDLFFIIIWSLLCIFLGLFLGRRQYNEVKDILLSHQWLFTSGKVVTSELYWTGEDYGEYYTIRPVANVYYSYRVESDEFKGKLHKEGTKRVEELDEKYPKGSEIIVYYHPSNPALSVVEPGINFSILEIIGSIIFFTIGIFMLVSGYSGARQLLGDQSDK